MIPCRVGLIMFWVPAPDDIRLALHIVMLDDGIDEIEEELE